MTLTYARSTDRVVADGYEAISGKIDALYLWRWCCHVLLRSAQCRWLRRDAFIGRGPNAVGTTVQLYAFTDTNVSIVIHYNSSEIESFEQIHPMIEKINDLVATYL